MLVTIVVIHAAFTLPHHITWLLSVFGHPNSVAKKLCVLLVIALSAAHPIIYGTLNKDFKRGFRSYVQCFKCCRSDSTAQQGSRGGSSWMKTSSEASAVTCSASSVVAVTPQPSKAPGEEAVEWRLQARLPQLRAVLQVLPQWLHSPARLQGRKQLNSYITSICKLALAINFWTFFFFFTFQTPGSAG